MPNSAARAHAEQRLEQRCVQGGGSRGDAVAAGTHGFEREAGGAQPFHVLPDRDAPVLTRELLYTGVTRAKSKLTWWAPNPAVLFSAVRQRVTRSGGLADGLFHPAK